MRFRLVLGLLIGALLGPAPRLLALTQGTGGDAPYLLKAEAAWVDPETRISPAYVGVRDGRIQSVSTRAPRGYPRPIELAGTLAPGIVDAWSGLLPADARASSTHPAYARLADSLPADVPFADRAFAARVAAARLAGISAAWLSSGAQTMERGLGVSVAFTENDMPRPIGPEALELAVGSAATRANSGAAGRNAVEVEKLADRFEAAVALREAREEYDEKLEEYDERLEEYREKLDEYAKKKDGKGGKQGGKNGGGKGDKKKDEAPSRARGPQDGGGPGKNGGEEEKEKPPKRPDRPKPPRRDPGLELILRVVEGELPVRVQADDARDIARLIELKKTYGFELAILGGRDADLLAEELAESEVSVVLRAVPTPPARRGAPQRPFAERYAVLQAAGVAVAIGSGGSPGGEGVLLIRAGLLVAAGADLEEVWASLTTVPAKILGLGEGHGRLAKGSSPDMILFEGASPFDASRALRTNRSGSRFE